MNRKWYRRSTWTAEDRVDFFAHLGSARSSKAQFLRLQALHLQQTEDPKLIGAAVELLDVLLSDFREPVELATAYLQRAECLAAQTRYVEALEAYRDALEAQRALPNVQTHASLGFGELALDQHREDLYDEVLAALEEFGSDECFPILEYRAHTIRALVAEARGVPQAKQHARRALAAARKTESPFRYHRKLGLVVAQKLDIEDRLKALAGE